ncbi:hypothetical protein QQ045_018747 [Rhodiola kirilowii]
MDRWYFFLLAVLWLCSGVSVHSEKTNVHSRPSVVNIGCAFSLNSLIGKVARIAINAAVEDVNSSPAVLGGTKLRHIFRDTNYSGFQGIIEVLKFMETDTVAIIGAESSVTAHIISHIANELKVPLLSYSATDPTLSSLQYPFFVLTAQSDLFQMEAIATIVDHYEWREVVAIYTDDDNGRNGIDVLGDKLAEKRCKIRYKAALRPDMKKDDITNALAKVALVSSRVLIVHVPIGSGLLVFDVAHVLKMMGNGYVWIATSWLSTILDTNRYSLPLKALQGVITLRMHSQDSKLKRDLISRWSNLTGSESHGGHLGLNMYGLYAYDTVWLLAHALNAFFNEGGNVSFANTGSLNQAGSTILHLDALSIFNDGDLLLKKIEEINMTGINGPISFTKDRYLLDPAFEVLNVIGTGYRKIGYWSNHSGLSVVPPETPYGKETNLSGSTEQLYSVIWPGETKEKPRGWVFPNNGKELIIGVPNRASFREFISEIDGTELFKGYCMDVFTAALKLMPYPVPYKLLPFGDGKENPSCTDLVRLIKTGVYDAAIGDIAIVTNRTRMVDFTQPYIESGLVVVAPVRKLSPHAWSFLRPFTPQMWGVTAVFFLVVGAVVWILEHRVNNQFRGPPKEQFVTTLWFSFSTLFFSHRERITSAIGRVVLIIWLFVVLIVNSSYTASLTSILTAQQLYSPIKGIESLVASDDPIGYQQGSFSRDYLIDELMIHPSRLIPLNSPEEYAKALEDGPSKGGVAAFVDESAYMELFLSTRCHLSIVGQQFTKNGWGFAFSRDSPLAVDFSTAILKLSETGELQRIHDKWLKSSACSSLGARLQMDRLELGSFSGLFIICGAVCFLAVIIYFARIFWQFRHKHSKQPSESTFTPNSRSGRLQTFLSFVDEKQEVTNKKKRTSTEGLSIRSHDNEELGDKGSSSQTITNIT